MDSTLRNLRSIILILCLSIFFPQCKEEPIDVYGCTEEIDLNYFYFMGSDFNSSIEYYDQYGQYVESFGHELYINFRDDYTFTLDLKMACDSVYSKIPLCEELNYDIGFYEIELQGTWDFWQGIGEYKYDCGGFWGSGEECIQKFISGGCRLYMDTINSVFAKEKIVNNFRIDCYDYSKIEYMDISLTKNEGDRIQIQISREF